MSESELRELFATSTCTDIRIQAGRLLDAHQALQDALKKDADRRELNCEFLKRIDDCPTDM
jgi:hypothetical protein